MNRKQLEDCLRRVVKTTHNLLMDDKPIIRSGIDIREDLKALNDHLVEELQREPNLLETANEVTGAGGARREAYAHPSVDFTCTARLITAILARQSSGPDATFQFTGFLPIEMVPLIMICVKLSRLSGKLDHADSALDIAGYARTLEMVWEKQQESF